jgi:hypothetical protein
MPAAQTSVRTGSEAPDPEDPDPEAPDPEASGRNRGFRTCGRLAGLSSPPRMHVRRILTLTTVIPCGLLYLTRHNGIIAKPQAHQSPPASTEQTAYGANKVRRKKQSALQTLHVSFCYGILMSRYGIQTFARQNAS